VSSHKIRLRFGLLLVVIQPELLVVVLGELMGKFLYSE